MRVLLNTTNVLLLIVIVLVLLVLYQARTYHVIPPETGVCDAANVAAGASKCPRLTAAHFTYLGGMRLPYGNFTGSTQNFTGGFHTGGGHHMAINPSTGTLFVSGYCQGCVAELDVSGITPAITPTWSALPQVPSVVQNMFDISEGHIQKDFTAVWGESFLTGLLVDVTNQKLIGSATVQYDANGMQNLSHFSHALTLATSSFSGWSAMSSQDGRNVAFRSGFMSPIPTEWQTALGGDSLTGQCCVSIVSRTSNGPAAFSFHAGDLGKPAVTSSALVYYTMEPDPPGHPTLGPWEGQNHVYGATTDINGMVLIPGTRTLLYYGRNGLGAYCYGDGVSTSPPPSGKCYDPEFAAKGQHAYPYTLQWWFYDVADLKRVKDGESDPWEPIPYAVTPIKDFPIPQPYSYAGGLAYNPTTRRLYVMETGADQHNGTLALAPILHVYSVSIPP